MERIYKYNLDRSSKKYICPACGKRTFVRYIDAVSGSLLPQRYGRCDREVKCSYHLNPYRDRYNQDDHIPLQQLSTPVRTFIPAQVLQSTLKGYEQNIFIQNLLRNVPFPFEKEDIERVISLYFLGSIDSGYRKGAVTFPFIDSSGHIHAIQVKQFDELNHTLITDFIHSVIEKQNKIAGEPLPGWLELYKNNQSKVSCMFGEHLVRKYPSSCIGLVEAPKSAVYATLYFGFPDLPGKLLWLASYNVSCLTLERCKVLKGRTVFLFPDLSKDGGAFDLWASRAKDFKEELPGTIFKVSDLLEKVAGEDARRCGLDIADFLIELDWRKFRKHQLGIDQKVLPGEKGEKGEAETKPFSVDTGSLVTDIHDKLPVSHQLLIPLFSRGGRLLN